MLVERREFVFECLEKKVVNTGHGARVLCVKCKWKRPVQQVDQCHKSLFG